MRVPRVAIITAGLLPVAALFALLIWALARGDGRPGGLLVFDSQGEAQIQAGRQATDFQLTLLDGSRFESETLGGKVVMLDFWASWCPPCRQEAPTLDRTYEKYRDQGVEFVGIAIWDNDDDVRDFVNGIGTAYPVGIDPRGALAVEYGVTGIPEKYFINRQGVIVKKYVGPLDERRLSQVLDEILAAPASTAS